MSADPSTVNEATPHTEPAKRSGAEVIKENSQALRGTIAEELRRTRDHFGDAEQELLKFHGTYQQEDRDARKAAVPRAWASITCSWSAARFPAAASRRSNIWRWTSWPARYGNGTLRFTSRQGIQFHGVLKPHLERHHRRHQRLPADHPWRVRRRGTQRHGLPRPAASRRRPR